MDAAGSAARRALGTGGFGRIRRSAAELPSRLGSLALGRRAGSGCGCSSWTGIVVAAWYGFRFARRESYYQSGRDPRARSRLPLGSFSKSTQSGRRPGTGCSNIGSCGVARPTRTASPTAIRHSTRCCPRVRGLRVSSVVSRCGPISGPRPAGYWVEWPVALDVPRTLTQRPSAAPDGDRCARDRQHEARPKRCDRGRTAKVQSEDPCEELQADGARQLPYCSGPSLRTRKIVRSAVSLALVS